MLEAGVHEFNKFLAGHFTIVADFGGAMVVARELIQIITPASK